jgi:hypothetical protein
MPTFGEFETIGEPLAITREAGHISTVWQAHGKDKKEYAIKCYSPRIRQGKGETHTLETDRGLEFLEGIKQLDQARKEQKGGACLAPIYGLGKTGASSELGLTSEGAWYATEYCRGKGLKEYVTFKGKVDSATLRHVVRTVLGGCNALQNARGYGHGNLKLSNVLLAGPSRPLKSRQLLITDPYPASPGQLEKLGLPERREVAELLREVIEAQDLRRIGEMILQLVEGRIINAAEYDYPLQQTPAWSKLGSGAGFWLGLCNRLLDPQLALANISIDTVRKEIGEPKNFGPAILKAAAVIAGLAVIGGAGYGGMRTFQKWSQNRKLAAGSRQQAFANALAQAEQDLDNTNFPAALDALSRLKDLDSNEKQQITTISNLAAVLSSADQALRNSTDDATKIEALGAAKTGMKGETSRPYSLWVNANYSNAIEIASMAFRNDVSGFKNSLKTTELAGLPSLDKRLKDLNKRRQGLSGFTTNLPELGADEEALATLTKAETQVDSTPKAAIEQVSKFKDYAAAEQIREAAQTKIAEIKRTKAKRMESLAKDIREMWQNNAPDAVISLASGLAEDSNPAVKEFAPPEPWFRMAKSDRDEEQRRFLQIRELSLQTLDEWRSQIQANYGPTNIASMISGWLGNDPIGFVGRSTNGLAAADAEKLRAMQRQAIELAGNMAALSNTAWAGGAAHRALIERGQKLVQDSISITTQANEVTKVAREQELATAREKYRSHASDGLFEEFRAYSSAHGLNKDLQAELTDADKQEADLRELIKSLREKLKSGDPGSINANARFTNNPDIRGIVAQAQGAMDQLQRARNLFTDGISTGNFSEATAICRDHAGDKQFDEIQGQIQQQVQELKTTQANLEKSLEAGKYSNIFANTRFPKDSVVAGIAAKASLATNDLEKANAIFNAHQSDGDFSKAELMCAKYGQAGDFKALLASIDGQKQRLKAIVTRLQDLLNSGKYDDIIASSDFPNNPDVIAAVRQANSNKQYWRQASTSLSRCDLTNALKAVASVSPQTDEAIKFQTSTTNAITVAAVMDRYIASDRFSDATQYFASSSLPASVKEVNCIGEKYKEAAKLCEQYSAATSFLQRGDYTNCWMTCAQPAVTHKAFADIQQRLETTLLGRLNALTNDSTWGLLQQQVSALSGINGLWGLDDFKDILKWLQDRNPERRLNYELQVALIHWDLKKNKEGFKEFDNTLARPINGDIDKNAKRQEIDDLERRYSELGADIAAKHKGEFRSIRDAINNYN